MLLIGEGTAEIQKMIIGRRLLEDYKATLTAVVSAEVVAPATVSALTATCRRRECGSGCPSDVSALTARQ